MHVLQDVQIHLKPDTHVKLSELKARLRKRSYDDVIRELLKAFESGVAGASPATGYEEIAKQIAEVLETHSRRLDGMLALMDKLEQVLRRLSQVVDSLEQFVEPQSQQAASATAPPATEADLLPALRGEAFSCNPMTVVADQPA
jgi:predicted CopG family antitoxin